jgi:hypothetical protein
MAVLKIPQSTQQAKAGGNLSGIDTTLPLNLARQEGAAISSVGKVFEDIYKEQKGIEDKKEFYKITREVGRDIQKVSSEVSKNSDLEFAHKTFDELTKRDKYDKFLADKNKTVEKLFDNWLLKTKDAEYSSITKTVIKRSNDEARGEIKTQLEDLSLLAASSDLTKAQGAKDQIDSILKQTDTVRLFSDEEFRKLGNDTNKRVSKYRVLFGAKNHPNYTLNNLSEIRNVLKNDTDFKEVKDAALTAIANNQSLIIADEEKFEKQSVKNKSAIFSEIVLRIKDNNNVPDLNTLNDLVKADQINSAQYDAILRFLEKKEVTSNDEMLDLIAGQFYIAETVEELDELQDMITVSPEYLLSVGIRDVDTMRTVIEKSKDRAVFADIKFYQKKIDDITGKIDGGGIYKTFGPKDKADQGIRRNANRIYNQYIADGYNAETAFMKTVNGYMLQQDKLPTIYDINQVTSIKITPPSDTQVKKDSDKVFDGWRDQVFAKYKNGSITINELKRDIDVLDTMEDVFNIRETVSKGFGFAGENSLSSKNETKATATK